MAAKTTKSAARNGRRFFRKFDGWRNASKSWHSALPDDYPEIVIYGFAGLVMYQ
jgi:hypothetical protein